MSEQKKKVLLKLDREAVKILLHHLAPYKGRFILGLGFGAIYGAVNGSVPLAIQQVMMGIFGGSASKSQIAEAVTSGGGTGLDKVIWTCAVIPFLMGIRSLFNYLNTYQMAWVSAKVLCDLRARLFGHLLKQGLDFFNRSRSGQLISQVANETRIAQTALTTISTDLVTQPVSLIVGIGVLLHFDWMFTLCTLVVFPVCLLPMIVYGRRVRKAGRLEEDNMSSMVVVLQETFAGLKVIKSFARENHELERFETANREQFKNTMRVRKSTEMISPMVEVVAAFGVGMALVYVYFKQLNAATFFALMSGIFLLYQPIKNLSRLHLVAQKCLAVVSSIIDLLRLEPNVVEAPDPKLLKKGACEIEFNHVSFQYQGADVPAIREVTLIVPAGSTVALVGASGAGKSSMFSMLLRFYDPQSGAVRINGTDLRELSLQSLRESIGTVTQETFLFHESIRDNIRYGRLDATDAEVEEAARQAYAHEFILRQPSGYDTVIGDKGCMLSGGQQQRLAIARALLKDAPLLLLDEATSALDSESEQQIQAALERLSQGRTVMAIAHRLSTILKADKIVVMDHGRVLETGTHAELLAKSAVYKRLYDLQFQHGSVEAASLLPEPTSI